ncbi:MAG: amylo-alpha-1,6-glucosidase, partial [Planctomycetota bacterium]
MILTLLERLERQGGGLRPAKQAERAAGAAAPRWCVVAGDGSGGERQVISSGRRTRDGSLLAERSDDGVFVAAAGAPTGVAPGRDVLSSGPGQRAESIVWVGDLALMARAPGRMSLGEPGIEASPSASGLELRWSVPSALNAPCAGEEGAEETGPELSLRLTLPCRPSGEVTFQNAGLDGDVWSSVSRDGRTGARMRPYASLPEIEFIPSVGSLELEGDGEWLLGTEVMHSWGEHAFEDRFSPGVFRWRLPRNAQSIGLSIRLMGTTRAESRIAALAAKRTLSQASTDPDEIRLRALGLPGQLILEKATEADASDALRTLVAESASCLESDRFDAALWVSRATLLVAPQPKGSLAVLVQGFHRRLVERLERDASSPAAPLAGLPRWIPTWSERLQPRRDEEQGLSGQSPCDDMVAVEHVALAHQALRLAEELSWRDEVGLAQRARTQARRLRRWFQEAFWLARPERVADLARLPSGAPDRIQALCLRPSMLVAASMEGAPLTTSQRQRIVRAAEKRLIVQGLGVASLDRDDLAFDGYSLENGAAWPCLAGFFVEASLRAFG